MTPRSFLHDLHQHISPETESVLVFMGSLALVFLGACLVSCLAPWS